MLFGQSSMEVIEPQECSYTGGGTQLLSSTSSEQRTLLDPGVPCAFDSADSNQMLRNDLWAQS